MGQWSPFHDFQSALGENKAVFEWMLGKRRCTHHVKVAARLRQLSTGHIQLSRISFGQHQLSNLVDIGGRERVKRETATLGLQLEDTVISC